MKKIYIFHLFWRVILRFDFDTFTKIAYQAYRELKQANKPFSKGQFKHICLANRWGWSRDKTRRFLGILASDEMVRINTTVHRTTITIENYALYNDVPTTDRQQIDSKPTASRQQAAQNFIYQQTYEAAQQ